MPNPYMQRRGDCYNFRIAVPADLRAAMKTRELVRTLKTLDRRIALPRALYLASKALTLFATLRAMPDDHRKTLRVDYSVIFDFNEDGSVQRIESKGDSHETDAINAIIRTGLEGASRRVQVDTPHPAQQSPTAASVGISKHTLKGIIESYLADYPATKDAMLKKHRIVLPIFLEFVGDKPISDIKQADIKGFFVLLNRLPPRAKALARKLKLSLTALAELTHAERLSIDTINDTYKASLRLFLIDAKRDWLDEGFPPHITTDGSGYTGTSKGGESKQRALSRDELKRLFEGPEFQGFSENLGELHKYWLPLLGLYTGARVNELCQINPQTDVFKDPATGIWCICLNEDSEAGEGIVKSMKGGKNRAIPMHRHLIELGFPEYLEAIKKTKAKQLFPAWKPRSGRAAPSAIDWFGTFLDEIGLRGVENENGRSLRGMHAFRHTLLTYGRLAGVNLRCISGHAEKSDNPVADGYEDDTLLTTLSDKLDRLDKLDYGLKFPVPLHIFNIT
jgi:integrase